MNFTYNSQAPKIVGLSGDYYQDANQNGAIDTGEPRLLHRLDSTLNFQWGTAGPDPGVIPPTYYDAHWSGGITAPSADSWVLVANADDGLTVKVNGSTVLSAPTCCSQNVVSSVFSLSMTATPIDITYAQITGAGYMDLKIRKASDPVGAEVPIPADWLTPTLASLPDGWSRTGDSFNGGFSALRPQSADKTVVVDATGADHLFSASAYGWLPPKGEDETLTQVPNGTWQLTQGGTVYLFDTAGRLQSVTQASPDTAPGAATQVWSSPNNDGVQRLTSITDPFGRNITLTYGPSASCPTASGYVTPPTDMLCKVAYTGFGGGSTDLYYSGSPAHLARLVNPGGATTDFGYDSLSRLISVRDVATNDLVTNGIITDPTADTHKTLISYDTGTVNNPGRVTSVQGPVVDATSGALTSRASHSYTYTLGSDGRITQADVHVAGVAEPNGYARRVTLDSAGHPTADRDAAGISIDKVWDGVNDVLLKTVDHHYLADPAGGLVSTVVYNDAWRPTDVYGPAPASEFTGQTSTTAPHTVTRYDEGMTGLAAAWYSNTGLSAPTAAHSLGVSGSSGVVDATFDGTTAPQPGIPATNFSLRLTGRVTMAQAGNYWLCATTDDGARVYLDDALIIDSWIDQGPTQHCAATYYTNPTAGMTHRIRIEYYNASGGGRLQLTWTRPDLVQETVPGTVLAPDYGLVTTSIDPDGKTTSTQYGSSPWLGLPTAVIQDPSGLTLSTQTGYETAGSGKYFRPISKTLPAGNQSTMTYYGTATVRDPRRMPQRGHPSPGRRRAVETDQSRP